MLLVLVCGCTPSTSSVPANVHPTEPDDLPDPNLDSDADTIPDRDDRCPHAIELINDVEDDDGCPDTGAFGIRLNDAVARREDLLSLRQSCGPRAFDRPAAGACRCYCAQSVTRRRSDRSAHGLGRIECVQPRTLEAASRKCETRARRLWGVSATPQSPRYGGQQSDYHRSARRGPRALAPPKNLCSCNWCVEARSERMQLLRQSLKRPT